MRTSRWIALTLVVAGGGFLAACKDKDQFKDWPLLGGDVNVSHNSGLSQVNTRNIGELGLAWIGELPSKDGLVGNPLVEGGRVFQSGAGAKIHATDLKTGKLLWSYAPDIDFTSDMSLVAKWGVRVNRGLALADHKAIVGTGDCRLIAVDQTTGAKVWQAKVCDGSQMETITAAPRVGGGMVFTGPACADTGMARGYVDAYDVKTGTRKWRFYTVPGDPSKPFEDPIYEKAAKTWGTGWYEKTKGCASVWDGMTYDSVLDRLYVPVAGPAPWSPTMRAADAQDELFTNSIVALDAKTGKYIWHYKLVPNDAWNFDANAQITIADLDWKGAKRRLLFTAPKNGFFYVLDAQSGQLLSAEKYTSTNWASHVDMATGRPVPLPDARYWEHPGKEVVVSPGPLGARSWQAMSWSKTSGLVFLGLNETPTSMSIAADNVFGGVSFDMYYGLKGDPKWPTYGELIAWDPLDGKARWRVKQKFPLNGGTLSTDGGLVFQGGADGKFVAYDEKTGEQLWSMDVGGSALAAPTTVELDGEQLILLPVGNNASSVIAMNLAKFASTPQTRTPSRLLAFKLGGKLKIEKGPAVEAFAQPPLPRPDPQTAQFGEKLFEKYACIDCHGLRAESAGGSAPDLRRASAKTHALFGGIVVSGLRKKQGMPVYPDMTAPELEAIQAYLLQESWKAFDAEQQAKTGPAKP